MPGYVKDALHKSHHPTPTRPQKSPHQWMAPKYGSTAPQLAHPEDDSPELNPTNSNTVQQFVGKFLYYAHAVYHTIISSLNTMKAQKSKSTQEIATKVVQLLNYAATHPEAITRYHAGVMTLYLHSDESFL